LTFKDLKKRISLETSQQQSKLLERLRTKPFWFWNIEEHKAEALRTKGDCCFNHIIGLPTKEGIDKPMFDYERSLYDCLLIPENSNPLNHGFKHKHLWVKKATGLGVTEFMLRLMVWLCLRDDIYGNSQMCIITGPNQDIAIKLIKRMKTLFEPHNVLFADKETVLEINGCTIEAFPSNHLDAYRALENPKFILIDEGDFFRKSEQEDVRHVSERYIAKSDPYIVMVSTPNAPDGLFERIEKESEETCIYKRLKLDYTYGLGKIYTEEEIDKAKQSPSFEREYNLKYLGLIGNVFHTADIDRAIEKGKQYNPDIVNGYTQKSIGLDPGFGSSPFGVVITEWVDNEIRVLHAEDYERPEFNEMIDTTIRLMNQFGIRPQDYSSRIYVDGANPEFIRSLKHQLRERPDYEDEIKFYQSNSPGIDWTQNMTVIPVHFVKEHRRMLAHAKKIIEYNEGTIAINPRFDKLITSLRTAVEKGEGSLDKDATSYDDILDAFRLSLQFYY
jgi:hypothetical protein